MVAYSIQLAELGAALLTVAHVPITIARNASAPLEAPCMYASVVAITQIATLMVIEMTSNPQRVEHP